ncbi:MAG: glycosyltransferase family 4 protein [Promethearchaeota archaeon]
MKITIVHSYLMIFGGGGIFLRDYANKLCEKGHDITIIIQKINHSLYKFNDKIKIIEVGGSLPSKPMHWLRFHKLKKKYVEVLKKLNHDIIISMYFPSNYFSASFDKGNDPKLVNYCNEPYRYFHDKEFYNHAPLLLRNAARFLRIFFKKYDIIGTCAADEIICNSNFTKKRVKKTYGREGIVHYIGVNIEDSSKKLDNFEFRQKLDISRNTPIIFSLGLSHHFKGTKELIIIFNKILKEIPESILLIGGKIKKENIIIIKKLVKKLKIPRKNIKFYGFIKEELLNSFYANSTLTLYTAINEAFGLIPLESMKNGTPVITFGGGPSETIINGKTGYVIKNNDLDDFTQKAINLIKNKKLNTEFSNNAIKHIRKNFNYDQCISNLESILLKIASKE